MKTMRGHTLAQLLAALFFGVGCCATVRAGLPAGISGEWFNPEQSGHGLSLQILAPDRALVFWYTYDAEGNPLTLYMDGRIEGRRIEATALAPRGMRFGSFDPSELRLPEWGTVSISFENCARGRLSWDAQSESFGSGEFDIVRLTGSHAEDCSLGDPALLASDVYNFTITDDAPNSINNRAGIGAVDPDGRIWALERLSPSSEQVPGPTYLSAPVRVLSASLQSETGQSETGSGNRSVVRQTVNSWAWTPTSTLLPVPGRWITDETGAALQFSSRSNQTWRPSSSNASLVRPLNAALMSRTHVVGLRGRFNNFPARSARLDVSLDGSICIRLLQEGAAVPLDCRFAGRYWLVDAEAGFFDFEITDVDAPFSPYRGRGWLQTDLVGDAIVLVGDNGHAGMGMWGR